MALMDGILLIDKPIGWTSFDVVAKIRGLIARRLQSDNHKKPAGKIRVGHSGTLDPLASGLLIILAGSYCKRAAEFTKLDKTYELDMTLGQTSTTGDDEGRKTAINNRQPAFDELVAATAKFTGPISQIPPAFSAIKVDGQRAYKLARAGKEVKLEPRQVIVKTLGIIDYHYPAVKLVAAVSSGTYIRSLVEDIGQYLGTGAYTSSLKRTKVGDYDLASASQVKDLAGDNISRYLIRA